MLLHGWCAADALLVLIFAFSFQSRGTTPSLASSHIQTITTFHFTTSPVNHPASLLPGFFLCFLQPRLSSLLFPSHQNFQPKKCLTLSRTPRGRRSTRPSSLPVSVAARSRRGYTASSCQSLAAERAYADAVLCVPVMLSHSRRSRPHLPVSRRLTNSSRSPFY